MKPSFLKDATRAGLYHLPITRRQALLEAAASAHLTILDTDLSKNKHLPETLGELGKAFRFPIWYGANLDALHDCLTDPDWPPGKGAILIISGLDNLRNGDPDAFSSLIEVLGSAAEVRAMGQHPLWILLTNPARGIPALPEA